MCGSFTGLSSRTAAYGNPSFLPGPPPRKPAPPSPVSLESAEGGQVAGNEQSGSGFREIGLGDGLTPAAVNGDVSPAIPSRAHKNGLVWLYI